MALKRQVVTLEIVFDDEEVRPPESWKFNRMYDDAQKHNEERWIDPDDAKIMIGVMSHGPVTEAS